MSDDPQSPQNFFVGGILRATFWAARRECGTAIATEAFVIRIVGTASRTAHVADSGVLFA